jgi:hypothetical protein
MKISKAVAAGVLALAAAVCLYTFQQNSGIHGKKELGKGGRSQNAMTDISAPLGNVSGRSRRRGYDAEVRNVDVLNSFKSTLTRGRMEIDELEYFFDNLQSRLSQEEFNNLMMLLGESGFYSGSEKARMFNRYLSDVNTTELSQIYRKTMNSIYIESGNDFAATEDFVSNLISDHTRKQLYWNLYNKAIGDQEGLALLLDSDILSEHPGLGDDYGAVAFQIGHLVNRINRKQGRDVGEFYKLMDTVWESSFEESLKPFLLHNIRKSNTEYFDKWIEDRGLVVDLSYDNVIKDYERYQEYDRDN